MSQKTSLSNKLKLQHCCRNLPDYLIKSTDLFLKTHTFTSRPIAVLKNFDSKQYIESDATYGKFLIELALKLSEAIPEEDWSKLLNLPGFKANPTGSVSEVLDPKLDSVVLYCTYLMGQIFWKKREVGAFSFNKMSLVSYPWFDKNPDLKLSFHEQFMNRIEETLDYFGEEDAKSLIQKYNFPITVSCMVNLRNQPDSLKSYKIQNGRFTEIERKLRYVNDYKGNKVLSDKQIISNAINLNEQERNVLQAYRNRQIYQLCQSVNNIALIVADMIRRGLKKLETFKHTTSREDILRLQQMFPEGKIVSGDESEWDKHQVKVWIKSFLLGLSDAGCDERMCKLIESLLTPAFLKPSDYIGRSSDFTYDVPIDDPFSKLEERDYGNTSGNAFVDIFGKALACGLDFATLVSMKRASATLEDAIRFLEWKNPTLCELNSSDDNAKNFSDPISKQCFIETRIKLAPGLKTEYDEEVRWLGWQGRYTNNQLIMYPNLVNGVSNVINREKSIKAHQNRKWLMGWRLRLEIYKEHPRWATAYMILTNLIKKYYNQDIDYIACKRLDLSENNLNDIPSKILDLVATRRSKTTKGGVFVEFKREGETFDEENLSPIDKEFIINPSIIHYKRRREDIHPRLLEYIFMSFPIDDSEKVNSHITRLESKLRSREEFYYSLAA